jgi:hypothetical protein
VEDLRVVDDQQVPAAEEERQLREHAVADLSGRAGQGQQPGVASAGSRMLRDETLRQVVLQKSGFQGVSPPTSVPG